MIRQDQTARKMHKSYNKKSILENPAKKEDTIRYYLQCLYKFLDNQASKQCVLLDGNAKMTIDTFRRTCKNRRRLARMYARKKLMNAMDGPHGERTYFEECLNCKRWQETLTNIPDWLKPHIIETNGSDKIIRNKDTEG